MWCFGLPKSDAERDVPLADDANKHGRHQMRHYCAAIQLADGSTITNLAAYLGHADPGFTLRVYGHFQPDSHDKARQAVDARFFKPRAVKKLG